MRIQTTSRDGFDRIRIRWTLDAHQVNAHSCERNQSGSDAHQGAHVKAPLVRGENVQVYM